ncbi:hypothetical protein ISF_06810 [Cordyceps fumosorosea ARSEF 2679]|uniref:Uncharacterized protein n=1 Tax=Cordyceps fumosorosea (strain ARSEF 2679) TaxID=1081104 RepID=A0A167R4S2_CORFA|nr:hypothetical protein ISF_06810 [Cordyceps fumosorosea ARSEF 2679]OAA58271.1 hypothetical protein ISF_06810 [Cordyceps fumosorosea ARSEF 2679]
MGFLAFLQRRQSDKTSSLSSPPSTITLQRSNASSATAKIRSRSDADLVSQYQQEYTYPPQHTGQIQQRRITTPTTPTGPTSTEFHHQQPRRRSDGGLLLLHAAATRPNVPSNSHSDAFLSRSGSVRSAVSRHVDLLDAQGQLGPSDFKARLQATGSREYGEDVAERNIGQNGLLLGSPAVQKFYATSGRSCSSPVPSLQGGSPRRQRRKHAHKEIILEQPEIEGSDSGAYRPGSRASSIYTARSMPITRARVTSISEPPVCTETRRASVASHVTVSSIGLPKLEEGGVREAVDADESDDAFPPSIPRFRRSEPQVPAIEPLPQRPASALGSVRRARQSVDVRSAYNMGLPIPRASPIDSMFHGDDRHRNLRSLQRQTLSVENMIRWRRTLGDELDADSDARSVATERATESRASQRQWSVTSTEPTERSSDASSLCCPRPASRATVTTSVDMRSLMDLEGSCEATDVDACSTTTDGSNVDAFVEKRRRRKAAAAEDKTLVFDEAEFFNGRGALPGLFDGIDDATPLAELDPSKGKGKGKRDRSQTLRVKQDDDEQVSPRSQPVSAPPTAPRTLPLEDAAPQPLEDDQCCSSAPGALVPRMYLTRRQRLLALGFDYDTDDDDDEDAFDQDSNKQSLAPPPQMVRPQQRLSIIVETPDDTAAAVSRRREAKRMSRGGGLRVRRVEPMPEEEGNLADME